MQHTKQEDFVAISEEKQNIRLPASTYKQLADDIEANGGIVHCFGKNHYLTKLLDRLVKEDPHKLSIYGPRGDPKRGKIQRKVWEWQKLYTDNKFDKDVLVKYNIKPLRYRNIQTAGPTQSQNQRPSQEPPQKQEEYTVSELTSALAKMSTNNSSSLAPAPGEKRPSPKNQELKTHFVTPHTKLPFHRDEETSMVIYVNTKWPEMNPPFEVHDCQDIPHLYETLNLRGFVILEASDERKTSKDENNTNYKTQILENYPNIIEMKRKVGISYLKAGEKEALNIMEEEAGPYLHKAIDATHGREKEQSEVSKLRREWFTYYLVFPDYVELTAEGLYAHKPTGNKRELFPAGIIFPRQQEGFDELYYWRVGRKDYVSTNIGRVERDHVNYDHQAMELAKERAKQRRSNFPFGSPPRRPGNIFRSPAQHQPAPQAAPFTSPPNFPFNTQGVAPHHSSPYGGNGVYHPSPSVAHPSATNYHSYPPPPATDAGRNSKQSVEEELVESRRIIANLQAAAARQHAIDEANRQSQKSEAEAKASYDRATAEFNRLVAEAANLRREAAAAAEEVRMTKETRKHAQTAEDTAAADRHINDMQQYATAAAVAAAAAEHAAAAVSQQGQAAAATANAAAAAINDASWAAGTGGAVIPDDSSHSGMSLSTGTMNGRS